jgi:hypothetical protein
MRNEEGRSSVVGMYQATGSDLRHQGSALIDTVLRLVLINAHQTSFPATGSISLNAAVRLS